MPLSAHYNKTILGQLNNPWGKKGRLESLHPDAGSAPLYVPNFRNTSTVHRSRLAYRAEVKTQDLGAAVVAWNLLFVSVAEMILPSEIGREGDHTSGLHLNCLIAK